MTQDILVISCKMNALLYCVYYYYAKLLLTINTFQSLSNSMFVDRLSLEISWSAWSLKSEDTAFDFPKLNPIFLEYCSVFPEKWDV